LKNITRILFGIAVTGMSGGFLASCVSAPKPLEMPSLRAVQPCETLVGTMPASVVGLPSGAVTIRSAILMAATPLSVNPGGPTPASLINPAKPEHCQVLGFISPLDVNAPNIEFQLNLPSQWNGRSVQFGGGGFNGVLITGTTLAPSGRYDLPAPLGKGFVTYGTDSGHQNKPNIPPQAFALNDEALENFTHASYKKVRDVAVAAMKRYYGQGPTKLYFVGSSEGGREGVMMAQRYPNDFDGIFSRVPVLNWVGLQMFGTRSGLSLLGANWVSPAKAKLVNDATLAACDALDGAVDSIVADYQRCAKEFDPAKLRCPNGVDGGEACLSDGQISAIKLLRSPLVYPYPLANGVTQYPGYAMGGEGALGSGPTGGWPSWWSGKAPLTQPASPTGSIVWFYGGGAVQYFFAQDANYDLKKYTPGDFPERTKRISQLMDATDPDLSAFKARGGKLIIKEQIADYAQSPYAGITYFGTVQAKMGEANVRSFARLYTAPGVDHVGAGAPANIDMLDVLVNWVERNQAPEANGPLVHVEQDTRLPFEVLRSRPMCEYPMVPRYKSGDVKLAASFACER
jgi:Tannase and feruloyl esterase